MKFFIGILMSMVAVCASAAEVISIVSPYTPAHKGHAAILDISGFHPPVFDKVPVGKYHNERVMLFKEALTRHQADINKFKKGN